MVPLKNKEILVAVDDCERLQRILAGHRLTIPHSVEEAKRELERREFAMVILGVLFDESRMFELLRVVRTFKANCFTRIVCMLTGDRKSTRLNSSHSQISYAVFCLKKKKHNKHILHKSM